MPLPLEEDKLMDLVEKAKDYCLMHGICMRQKDKFDRDALHFAPFCLFPSPFPSDEYYKAVNLQVIVNELMHKVNQKKNMNDDAKSFLVRCHMTTTFSKNL